MTTANTPLTGRWWFPRYETGEIVWPNRPGYIGPFCRDGRCHLCVSGDCRHECGHEGRP